MNKEILGAVLTFSSVNDLLSRSGVNINTKIKLGGPGEPFAEPTLFEVFKKNKDGTFYTNPRTGKKVLLGRVPVLDSQFTIPRPVTSATITFHGLCAFNSIAFYGRRADLKITEFVGIEISATKGLVQRKLEFLNRLNRGDILICTETSRLSRSVTELPTIVDELLRRGVRLKFVNF